VERDQSPIVAFATIDAGALGRTEDALAQIWNELRLPAILPRDPDVRGRSCGPALNVIGDRVRMHLTAMREAQGLSQGRELPAGGFAATGSSQ
jgi:hypothetical protein